jgi:hypothetical protein
MGKPEILVSNQLILYPQAPATNLKTRRSWITGCGEPCLEGVNFENGSACNAWFLGRCLLARACVSQDNAFSTRTGDGICESLREVVCTVLIPQRS